MTLTSSFDKHRDKKNEPDKPKTVEDILYHETPGNARNVCFVMPDGKQRVFYYADMMCEEYDPEASAITLMFRTHEVVLKGSDLENLFESFKAHVPKQISLTDKRYVETKEKGKAIITQIVVQKI